MMLIEWQSKILLLLLFGFYLSLSAYCTFYVLKKPLSLIYRLIIIFFIWKLPILGVAIYLLFDYILDYNIDSIKEN